MKLYLLSILLILTGCFFEEEKPTLSKNFGKYGVEVRIDHKARMIELFQNVLDQAINRDHERMNREI